MHEGYYTARSDNGEWYTPSAIIEKARLVLGSIDFDPYSSAVANNTVRATQFLTRDDDALLADWPAVQTMWCNPPYGSLMEKCIRRAVSEHKKSWHAGIFLVNNATDTVWFRHLTGISSAMCLFHRRIKFNLPDGSASLTNTRGQIALYVGAELPVFVAKFQDMGTIVRPVES